MGVYRNRGSIAQCNLASISRKIRGEARPTECNRQTIFVHLWFTVDCSRLHSIAPGGAQSRQINESGEADKWTTAASKTHGGLGTAELLDVDVHNTDNMEDDEDAVLREEVARALGRYEERGYLGALPLIAEWRWTWMLHWSARLHTLGLWGGAVAGTDKPGLGGWATTGSELAASAWLAG